MTSELFPDSSMASDSPRLIWLRKHNLALGELPSGQRYCASFEHIVHGETHRECEEFMARALDIHHWSIEEFAKAGVVIPEAGEEVC